MNELEIDGKKYVSSKRAAELTGYAKDYVGQLCREGRVVARQVGRAWYVLETSLMEHRYASEEPARGSRAIASTWEAPRYAAETPNHIPEMPKQAAEPDAGTVAAMQAAWQEWFSLKKVEPEREPELEAAPAPDVEQEQAEEVVASEAQNDPLEGELIEMRVQDEYEAPAQQVDVYEDSAPVEIPIERMRSEPLLSQAHFDMPAMPAYAYTPAPEGQHAAREEAFDAREAEAVAARHELFDEMEQERRSGSWALRAFIGLVVVIVVAIGILGSGIADPYLQRFDLNRYTSFITGTVELAK